MARKDSIFLSFIKHKSILDEYKISEDELPRDLREGLESHIPIIRAIAIIVHGKEVTHVTNNNLYTQLTQFLNQTIL